MYVCLAAGCLGVEKRFERGAQVGRSGVVSYDGVVVSGVERSNVGGSGGGSVTVVGVSIGRDDYSGVCVLVSAAATSAWVSDSCVSARVRAMLESVLVWLWSWGAAWE